MFTIIQATSDKRVQWSLLRQEKVHTELNVFAILKIHVRKHIRIFVYKNKTDILYSYYILIEFNMLVTLFKIFFWKPYSIGSMQCASC